MLQNAVYSVISPRGFASILWKNAAREQEAANMMRITAHDLVELGVAEHIIPEAEGGAHNDPRKTAENIAQYLIGAIKKYTAFPIDLLLQNRYDKFRKIGEYTE